MWIARVAGAGCSAGSMVIFGRKYGWSRRIQNASIEDRSSFVSSHSIAQHSGGVGKPATGADNTIKEESFSGQA